MENIHARLVDKGTKGALAQSQEIQLKAILARFGGDRKAAADYCWRTSAAFPAVMSEYLDYRYILEGQAVSA